MTEAQFAKWWSALSTALKPGTEVFHWSAHSQYQLNGSFRIVKIDRYGVWYDQDRYATPTNFRDALNIWSDYCGHTITRKSFGARVPSSTYVISIIRWMEKNAKQPTTRN